MNLNIKNNIQILNLTLHNIRDREFYNFRIIFRTGYCYKTHFLFFQLVLSPKTPVLRRLFFIPLAKLGVTVLFVLYTPFFQLFFHIHAGKRARTLAYTQDSFSIYQPSHSVSDPSTTHAPFSVLIFTPPILSLYEQAMHKLGKKRKQQDETLPPSRLTSLHFDNWETFGTIAQLLRYKLWL